MSRFDGIPFRVIPDDGYYPQPVRDGEGVPRLRADIIFDSDDHYRNLQDRVTIATYKRPLGTMVINPHIESMRGQNGGIKLLVYPALSGRMRSYSAILETLDAAGYGRVSMTGVPRFRASAQWVILTDLTGDLDP